jgi:hypothetical protein
MKPGGLLLRQRAIGSRKQNKVCVLSKNQEECYWLQQLVSIQWLRIRYAEKAKLNKIVSAYQKGNDQKLECYQANTKWSAQASIVTSVGVRLFSGGNKLKKPGGGTC